MGSRKRTPENFPRMRERGVRRRQLRPVRRMAKVWRTANSETLRATAVMLEHWLEGGTFDTLDTPERFYVVLT